MTNLLLNHLCHPLQLLWRTHSCVPRRDSSRRLSLRSRNCRIISKLAFFVALASFPLLSPAANLTLQGNFTADDSIQLFSMSLAAPAAIDIRSYGYAGGTASTGALVPRGGFDTILTLFNASGVFIDDNDDGAGAAVDPQTGQASDARITANLAAGGYIVALTQYDNFSIGDLADGFAETGHPNFTADSSFTAGGACAGNMFRDISGTDGRCRTGNWAVDFLNVSSVAPITVPEPSALLLAGFGLSLLVVGRLRHWRKTAVAAGALVATLASVSAQAQTSPPPDYNNVSDILNGRRSLLQVTDVMVSLYDQKTGRVYSTPVTYSNSQPALGNQFGWSTQAQSSGPSFSALMWNGASATTITVVNGDVNNAGQRPTLDLLFQTGTNTANWFSSSPLGLGSNPGITDGAAADFTADGFDDLALITDDGRLLVITANNVNDLQSQIRENATPVDTLSAIAAGDFNGDGSREIAGLAIQPDGSLKLEIYTVDPNSLAVTLASSITLTAAGSPIAHVSMAPGRFASVNHDQLAVAFATNSGPGLVEIIDFTPNTLTPHEASATLGNPASNVPITPGYIQVKTGKFNVAGNSYDSIVYHSSSGNTLGRFFEILAVDPTNYNVGGTVPITYDQLPCAQGIQVGNFDHRQGSDPNLNAQIAFMYCNNTSDDSGNPGFSVNIYSVNPSTLNISGPDSAFGLTGVLAPDGSKTGVPSFAVSDLQGRSLTLGEPQVIDIDNMDQPTVVVGAPPMHVDFVSPDGTSAPQLINLSAVPRGYNNTYESESSDENPQSTSHTSSWSWGAQESFGAKATIGDIKGGSGYSIGDKFTAAQQLSGSIDSTYGTFSAKTYGLSSTPGLADYVTHNETILRVWVYPVIGQTVCPSDKTCPPDAQVPLTIQFSAPLTDNNPITEAASNLSWYQPPWEPGNILSYPANLTQLQNMYQGQGTCPGGTAQNTTLCTLAAGNSFRTDDGTITETTKWQVGSSTSTVTSFNQNYSFDNDLSVAGSIGKAGVAQAQFTADFDVSGSFGFSTLTNNSTTLALSTGLEVKKPGTFLNPTVYGYYVTPYILGTTVPGGVVDNKPLNQGVQTFGVTRAVFTADPFLEGQSTWWNQIYSQAPDVALNHPVRWTVTSEAPLPGLTCIAVPGFNSDCVSLATPKDPNNPGLDSFHQMRGFFISSTIRDPNSNSCNATGGQGPQLESAVAGDCLYLQARVYNYSLKAMDPGTQVHVRFYFTPWGSDSKPAGDSVLIADVPAGQLIPPFDDTEVNGQAAPANWILVPAQFDPNKFEYTQNGNVNIRFWAVVWMEDGNGNLVGEIPGHGLTGIPGTLISLADAAKLEECQSDGSCYSNNVGFYNQNFYIYPLNDSLGAPLPPPHLQARSLQPRPSEARSQGLRLISAS